MACPTSRSPSLVPAPISTLESLAEWSTVRPSLPLPSLLRHCSRRSRCAEPMTDLFAIFSKLVTSAGEILIPGIADKVAPLTTEEKARYEVIDITVADFESAAGGKVTLSQDKATALMGRMRYPRYLFWWTCEREDNAELTSSLTQSLHSRNRGRLLLLGSQDCHPRRRPRCVFRLFLSARSVLIFARRQVLHPPRARPHPRRCQCPRDRVSDRSSLSFMAGASADSKTQAEFAKLGSKNTFKMEMLSGGMPWMDDINTPNYRAATKVRLLPPLSGPASHASPPRRPKQCTARRPTLLAKEARSRSRSRSPTSSRSPSACSRWAEATTARIRSTRKLIATTSCGVPSSSASTSTSLRRRSRSPGDRKSVV